MVTFYVLLEIWILFLFMNICDIHHRNCCYFERCNTGSVETCVSYSAQARFFIMMSRL
ncbi:hypothetical protein ACP275_11G099900 [Erythranthe tilingii]